MEHIKQYIEKLEILDLLGEEYYLCDQDFNIVYTNKALTDSIGSNVDGEKCFKAIYHSDEVCEWCAFNKHSKNNNMPEFNIELEEEKLIKRVRSNILDNGYRLTRLRDITKSKAAEIELEKINNEFREAERLAHLGHWEFDIINNILKWSEEVYRIFETVEENQVSYELFLDHIHPDDRESVNKAYQCSLNHKTTYDIEHRIITNQGNLKYVREKCINEFDENGNPIRSFGLVWDITDQKNKEAKLKKSEEKFHSFIKNMPEPIVITNPNGVIEEVNGKFEELYGYSRDELIGTTPRLLNPGRKTYYDHGFDESYYNDLFSTLWCSIKNKEIGYWKGFILNRKKNGDLIWAELNVSTVFSDSGEILYYLGQPVDVSTLYEREANGKVELYRTMALMSELRDNETGNHMRRVGLYAKRIAEKIGQTRKFCEDIEIFATMHDLGKIGISDTILNAPRKLTPDEYEIMKTHTNLGYNILNGTKDVEMAAEITKYHHEKWDGTGYPENLKGEEIPIAARITAFADVYDALRNERPYKKAWSHEQAVSEIVKNAGIQFDPYLVSVFLELSSLFDRIHKDLSDYINQ